MIQQHACTTALLQGHLPGHHSPLFQEATDTDRRNAERSGCNPDGRILDIVDDRRALCVNCTQDRICNVPGKQIAAALGINGILVGTIHLIGDAPLATSKH